MHLDVISNGNGAQSIAMLVLAAKGVIKPRVAICGDTHWEEDRLWSDGTRSSAIEYFNAVVAPFAKASGIAASMVTKRSKDGTDWNLQAHTRQMIAEKQFNHIKIPLFGSEGGRLLQACTDRAKISALNQAARALGATSATQYIGIHIGEADRRLSKFSTFGIKPLRTEGQFNIWPIVERIEKIERPDGRLVKTPRFRQWTAACYPLVDLRLTREDCQRICDDAGLAYLISSECDCCPHQDIDRWDRHTPEVIDELATLEARMDGQFFFTSTRIPLKAALVQLRYAKAVDAQQGSLSFGCDSGGYCGQ